MDGNFKKSERALIALDISVIIAFLALGTIFYTDARSNKRPQAMLTLTALSALGATVTGGILSKDIKTYRNTNKKYKTTQTIKPDNKRSKKFRPFILI